jgi:hypothetical protein
LAVDGTRKQTPSNPNAGAEIGAAVDKLVKLAKEPTQVPHDGYVYWMRLLREAAAEVERLDKTGGAA